MRSRQLTWMFGGIGLIVSGVLDIVGMPGSSGFVWVNLLGDFAYAASVLLFVFGTSPSASVVARAPVAIAAAIVLVVSPFAESLLYESLRPSTDQGPNLASYLMILVPACAALVVTVQIGRARVVPPPWRWLPAWVLAGQAALWVVPQIAVTSGSADVYALVDVLASFGVISVLAGTIGLGTVAVYLAAKQRPETTQVFRSP